MKNLKIQFPLINLKKKNRISLEISIEKRKNIVLFTYLKIDVAVYCPY